MKILCFLASLIIFISCSDFKKEKHGKGNSRIIAKVDGNFLYEKDITGMFKGAPSKKDSQLLRKDFINNWLREQLIYRKALSNLTDEEKDKNAELEEYYHSLIKYEYLNKIVDQRLNRNVSDLEIETYYEQNKDIFLLPRCLVKLIYVKIHTKSRDLGVIKRWFNSNKQTEKDYLLQYCLSKSLRYSLDPEKWFYFDELAKEIPMKELDCNNITPGNYYENTDSLDTYLLTFLEIRHEGSYSPIQFEKERVRNIILYKRRLDIIKQVENEIYKEGLQKQYFKIYE